MSEGRPLTAVHPLNTLFLASVALDAPLAFIGLFFTHLLPLIEVSNTAIVFIKLWSLLTIATCLASVLVSGVPDYLPGKRALALSFILYHTGVATIFFTAPRFVPVTFGDAFESLTITPERSLAGAHMVLGLLVTLWWQATLPLVQAARDGKLAG